jgi:hypothetical protein
MSLNWRRHELLVYTEFLREKLMESGNLEDGKEVEVGVKS